MKLRWGCGPAVLLKVFAGRLDIYAATHYARDFLLLNLTIISSAVSSPFFTFSTIVLNAKPSLGSESIRRLRSAIGARVSYCLSSSGDISKAPASLRSKRCRRMIQKEKVPLKTEHEVGVHSGHLASSMKVVKFQQRYEKRHWSLFKPLFAKALCVGGTPDYRPNSSGQFWELDSH